MSTNEFLLLLKGKKKEFRSESGLDLNRIFWLNPNSNIIKKERSAKEPTEQAPFYTRYAHILEQAKVRNLHAPELF